MEDASCIRALQSCQLVEKPLDCLPFAAIILRPTVCYPLTPNPGSG